MVTLAIIPAGTDQNFVEAMFAVGVVTSITLVGMIIISVTYLVYHVLSAIIRIIESVERILRAAGSSLRHYMPSSKDDLRKAMRGVLASAREVQP